jgi:hypothetical protein
MSEKVLLIGNGINLSNQQYYWKDLLYDLIHFIGKADIIRPEEKLLTLLYEEIYLRAIKIKDIREYEIKKEISRLVDKIESNEIHKRIMTSGFEHILTANYDYSLENSLSHNSPLIIKKSKINEQKYSLFRQHSVGNKTVWHIHGDKSSPNSIMLGYEQYSGYLQQMRSYATEGAEYTKAKFKSPKMKYQDNDSTIDSWLDLFLLHDIYIIGLGLDFTEMHLWWLITFRARMLNLDVLPNRNIYYIYPEHEKDDRKIEAKLELLEISDVKTKSIRLCGTDWLSFYSNAIEFAENSRGSRD